MQRKILLIILFVVLVVALLFKSPFAAMFNYKQAMALYNSGKYEQALPYFERGLIANPNDLLIRYFYANTLAKVKPRYSVQKKLYELSEYKTNDSATRLAKSKASQVKYTLLNGIGNNYIYNAASGSDIIRWDTRSFPLKVYIEKSDVPQYYIENIRSALKQWTNRTTFVRFNEVNNEPDAQIVIRFKDIDASVCNGGVCRYVVAYTEPTVSGNTLKKMTLTFYKTNPRNEKLTQREVYTTALHEIGHTLGIMGHSESQGDIMYAAQDNNSRSRSIFGNTRLSDRDLKTLVLLYRTKPTISNAHQNNENYYYAPLVIGSDDVLVRKKIEELTKYIQAYPHIATGYINLGGAYGDIGDFGKAHQYMVMASKYAKTPDEKYLIAYNRALIYYNMQDFDKAIQFAQQAQSIRNDSSVAELIDEIQKLSK